MRARKNQGPKLVDALDELLDQGRESVAQGGLGLGGRGLGMEIVRRREVVALAPVGPRSDRPFARPGVHPELSGFVEFFEDPLGRTDLAGHGCAPGCTWSRRRGAGCMPTRGLGSEARPGGRTLCPPRLSLSL